MRTGERKFACFPFFGRSEALKKRLIRNSIFEVLFPENLYCISCSKPIKKEEKYSLCDSCREGILYRRPPTCPRCGSFVEGKTGDLCKNCGAHEPVFDKGLACLVYTDGVKSIIYKYKYGGNAWMSRPMAEIMDGALVEAGGFDLIVPVPMFRAKEKLRGFCQTTLLAEEIGRLRDKPVLKRKLIRTKMTRPMSGLSAEERRTNIREAFAVVDGEMFIGKRILLIDDLVTTGSTANACAKVLINEGATKIILAAFASPMMEKFDNV